MYVVEPSFWLRLILVLTVFIGLTTLFNAIIRKWLKVEKPKAFSHNHVNDRHKKIDWTLRIFFIVLMIIGASVNAGRIGQEPYLFLQPWVLLFVLVFTSEIIRAVMERKYAENPNAYLSTIYQSAFILVLLIVLFSTGFFGIL